MKGVDSIIVNLEEKQGQVSYNPDLLSCDDLVSFIDNIADKFSASLISDGSTIFISGMTCQSCVRYVNSFMMTSFSW